MLNDVDELINDIEIEADSLCHALDLSALVRMQVPVGGARAQGVVKEPPPVQRHRRTGLQEVFERVATVVGSRDIDDFVRVARRHQDRH